MLAISPWTIRAYIKSGRLIPVKIGRAVRLEESELLKFIERSKHHAVKPAREGQNTSPEVVA